MCLSCSSTVTALKFRESSCSLMSASMRPFCAEKVPAERQVLRLGSVTQSLTAGAHVCMEAVWSGTPVPERETHEHTSHVGTDVAGFCSCSYR